MSIITTAGAAPITKRSALVESLASIAILVAITLASAADQIPPTIQARETVCNMRSTSFRSARIRLKRAVERPRSGDRPRRVDIGDFTPAVQHPRSRQERAGTVAIRARSARIGEITKGLVDDSDGEVTASVVDRPFGAVRLGVLHRCSLDIPHLYGGFQPQCTTCEWRRSIATCNSAKMILRPAIFLRIAARLALSTMSEIASSSRSRAFERPCELLVNGVEDFEQRRIRLTEHMRDRGHARTCPRFAPLLRQTEPDGADAPRAVALVRLTAGVGRETQERTSIIHQIALGNCCVDRPYAL